VSRNKEHPLTTTAEQTVHGTERLTAVRAKPTAGMTPVVDDLELDLLGHI
jgi:hypothetical protein